MPHQRIHIVAPAGSCSRFFEPLGVASSEELVAIVQSAVGSRYIVSADHALISATEDEMMGGRKDDQRRATDLEDALADDSVVAVASLRGGSWFTRILPRIDFSVLDRRTTPVVVTGFSELTTLVNIVSAYRSGIGVYAMGPTFLTYGLRWYAANHVLAVGSTASTAKAWMTERLRPEFERFFQDFVATIEGRSKQCSITARIVHGDMPLETLRFIGGNLTVLSTLIGSRYEGCIDPKDRWILLEDFNDNPPRLDRLLSRLTLAGYFDRCAGVLLGDFHEASRSLTEAVVAMLEHHLPSKRSVPVLVTNDIGHIWPVTPVPLNIPMTVSEKDNDRYDLRWSASAMVTSE